jgi:lysophospholipase L1-like esterase
MYINSHGLRSPEITYEKPPAVFRILNLGDSTVAGWGVREEDTYGRRLEQLLTQQNTGGTRFEVINAGVPGWNLENALAYLQAEGLKYEPDLVLLGLSTANDINGKSALLARGQPAPIEWLRANTYFWPFLTIQLRWMEARLQGRERIEVIDPPTNPAKYFPQDPHAERWTNIWDLVLAINRLSRENNAQFMLVEFPLEFQVLDQSYPTLVQEIISARAAEVDIKLVDVLPAFRQACQEKPGGACQLEDRYLFADLWMHPSAYGHEVIAAELEKALAGFLPK